MEYIETPTGGAEAGGCATIDTIYNFTIDYQPGDILYSRQKALKEGKFEKVVIKKLKTVKHNSPHGLVHPIYWDTFNSVWNEDDLVTYAEAVELSLIYYQRQLYRINSVNLCANE